MLFIDKKQVSIEEFAAQFGLPLAKIDRAPIFDVHPSRKRPDKLNGGYISPVGTQIPCFFMAEIGGKKVEVRWAEGVTDVLKGEKMVEEYYPAKTRFLGASDMIPELDRALYLYVHPLHEKSPFRHTLKETWHWTFVDNEQRAESIMQGVQEMSKALTFIQGLKGEHLKTVAKGLGIPAVDTLEPIEIQARLTEMAQGGGKEGAAARFNERVQSKQTLFTGIIRNSVDKGIFKLVKLYNTSRWVWNAGPQNGQPVVDILTNAAIPEQVLIEHINANINDYYGILVDLQTTAVAENTAQKYLEQVDLDPAKLFKEPAPRETPPAPANTTVPAAPAEEAPLAPGAISGSVNVTGQFTTGDPAEVPPAPVVVPGHPVVEELELPDWAKPKTAANKSTNKSANKSRPGGKK